MPDEAQIRREITNKKLPVVQRWSAWSLLEADNQLPIKGAFQ
jgi:hypothetical protein